MKNTILLHCTDFTFYQVLSQRGLNNIKLIFLRLCEHHVHKLIWKYFSLGESLL